MSILFEKPFIKPFQFKGDYYIYDVNLNEILQVDELTYRILFLSLEMMPNNIIKTLENDFSSQEINQKLQYINELKKKHSLFGNNRIKKVVSENKYDENTAFKKTKEIIINVSEACNMRCKYCLYSGKFPMFRKHTNKLMSLQVAKNTLSWILNNHNSTPLLKINFYGGEPLLNFETIRLFVSEIKRIKQVEKKVKFKTITNGTLLNTKNIHFFLQNKIGMTVSLDGPPGIHDKNRVFLNGNGSYQKIIQNLENIYKLDKEYYNNCIRFNVTYIPEVSYKTLQNYFNRPPLFSLDKINIWPLTTPYNIKKNYSQFSLSKEKYLYDMIKTKWFKNVIEKLNKLPSKNAEASENLEIIRELIGSNTLLQDLIMQLSRLIKRTHIKLTETYSVIRGCIPGKDKLFIDVNGNFYACENIPTVGVDLRIGSIYEGLDINRINHIKEMIDSKNKKCTECWAIRFCSLCYVHIGKSYNIRDQACNAMKQKVETSLKMYVSSFSN